MRKCRFNRLAQTECGSTSGSSTCVPLKDCTKNTANHLGKALAPGKEAIPEWKLILSRVFIFDQTMTEVNICQKHRDDLGNTIDTLSKKLCSDILNNFDRLSYY